MEQSKIDLFVMQHTKLFDAADMMVVREQLERMRDEAFVEVIALPYKKPITTAILAWGGGALGLDAFYLGRNAFGLIKLLIYFAYVVIYITYVINEQTSTLVVACLPAVAIVALYIVSIVNASKWTKQYNFSLFMEKAARL